MYWICESMPVVESLPIVAQKRFSRIEMFRSLMMTVSSMMINQNLYSYSFSLHRNRFIAWIWTIHYFGSG
ncbi:unnamed protein product, partial [Amoebophrya sp. A25]|eukprot:GSA25T00002103001.1